MNGSSGAMCRIPIRATMQYVNGVMTMVNAEWADIPADAIARFLIEKFGLETERDKAEWR
jgi:hypothetical protein